MAKAKWNCSKKSYSKSTAQSVMQESVKAMRAADTRGYGDLLQAKILKRGDGYVVCFKPRYTRP